MKLLRLSALTALAVASSLSLASVAHAENHPAAQAPHVAPRVQAPQAHAAQPAHVENHAAPAGNAAHGNVQVQRQHQEQPQAHVAPAPSVVQARAREWAAKHKLPVREIEVGPADRRVKRLFVPITPENWKDFVDTFGGNQPRSLMLKLKGGDSHLMPVIDGDAFLWGRSVNKMGYDHYYGMGIMGNDGPNGPAMVVELTDDESQHVRQWFGHRADPNDALWGQQCGNACMDFIGNIEVAPGADGTNTLRAINAQEINGAAAAVKGGKAANVPTGRKLFDVLGIARSKDGRNMTYNMIHAASDRVQVVGVPMGMAAGGMEKKVVVENGRKIVKEVPVEGGALDRFTKMTDAELLGPLPPQGVAGVVRPVK